MKTLKLVAWPYSRKLVIALCEYNNSKYTLTRDSKTHETFEIDCDEEFIEKIKSKIKEVNDKAKFDNLGTGEGFSTSRNIIVEHLIKTMSTPYKLVCPVSPCRSTKIIKNGKDKSGTQKYKCKSCSNNFKV